MSSFVISKVEFVKAAGLMSGFEKSKKNPHKWFVENIHARFADAYIANEISVAYQYNREIGTIDRNDYTQGFERAEKVAIEVFTKGTEEERDRLRYTLINFFSSIDYQVEDKEQSMKVRSLLFECTEKLLEKEIKKHRVKDCWGCINLQDVALTK